MAKPKACKLCRTIVEGPGSTEKCPNCGSKELTEGFKGRTEVLNPEKSEIAQKLNLKEKGNFAIKAR
jgi:DNA-directed RNA polymerase subunit E"